MRQNNPNTKVLLNIFALPNQTTFLFGIIITVILGAVLVGSVGVSPVPIRPLALFLLVLPLRSFLASPTHKYFQRYHRIDNHGFGPLQDAIDTLSRDVGLSRTPELAIFQEGLPLHTFGTFRHWYVAVNFQDAMRLQDELEHPERVKMTQARLYHELYHFKTGDYWQLGYAGELLRLTFQVMLWAFIFALGYGGLLIIAKPDILALNPSELIDRISETAPAEIQPIIQQVVPFLQSEYLSCLEQVREKIEAISVPLAVMFAISATYPFAIIGGILRLLFWRKLWRVREFYADAGSVQVMGQVASFLKAFGKTASFTGKPATETRWELFSRLLRVHPTLQERIAAIKNPASVFGSWFKTAVLAGSLALVLEFLTMTPLTLLQTGSWPMHFPVMSVFVIVSLNYLIPAIAQGEKTTGTLLKIVGVVTVIRLAIVVPFLLLLLFLLYASPQALAQILSAGILVTARYAGTSPNAGMENLYAFVYRLMAVNLVQIVLLVVILVLSVLLTAFCVRRIFSWYSYPDAAHRLIKAVYTAVVIIGCFVGFTVLPISTVGLLEPANLFNSKYIVLEMLGGILMVLGIVVFLVFQGKYAYRCPTCGAKTAGKYWLGKCCETGCGTILHPWLIADYDVSISHPASSL